MLDGRFDPAFALILTSDDHDEAEPAPTSIVLAMIIATVATITTISALIMKDMPL